MIFFSFRSSMFSFFERQINPYPQEVPTQPPSTLFGFCWHYAKDAWPWLLALGFLGAFLAAGEVLLFYFMGNLVDWLSQSDKESFIEKEGLTLLLLAFFILAIRPISGALHTIVLHQALLGNFPMIARWQMHRYLLSQSMDFYANEFAGRIATKVMQTALAIRDSIIRVMDVFIYIIVYFVSMFILVASADWRLMLPLAFWMVIYIALSLLLMPKLREASTQQADARSMMTGRIVDSYTNISTVKLFSHAGVEAQYARDGMDGFLKTVYKQMRLVSVLQILMFLNNSFVIAAIAGMGIWLWMGDLVTIGAIAAAMALALRLNGMSDWVMWEFAGLFEQIGIIHDGISMLSKPQEIKDKEDASTLTVDKGEITFKNVTFNYGKQSDDETQKILNDFNLTIQSGEKIGLVGRSGAGKTTITNLLLRFYDIEKGIISIDGQAISDVTQESLRAHIGVVTQDSSLLHRSIRENIAYGNAQASEDEIITAAKRANAYEFIEGLEDQQGRKGLDAQVGERGVKLSGGQRQRIAIARVFLKDAPILVLDEATSALDSEVEAAIQENLFELMEGKTVIAIAHRLSTISELDRLVIMDNGTIIEEGTHEALHKSEGTYAKLWARQSGGFITEPKAVKEGEERE